MIEIYENYDMECLSLDGMWTIQDKASQNKKRFAFEVMYNNIHCSFIESCSHI